MRDEFERKVTTAAVAGWWGRARGRRRLTASWIAYLTVVPAATCLAAVDVGS